MARASLTTGYARLTPRQARVALGAVVATFMAGVAVTLSPLASTNLKPHPKRDERRGTLSG